MKTASQSLIAYLKASGGVHGSYDLQRLPIKNGNGTNATPRSLVRRLEEQAELGVLAVTYDDHGNAQYRYKSESEPPKPSYMVKHPFEDRMITTAEHKLL